MDTFPTAGESLTEWRALSSIKKTLWTNPSGYLTGKLSRVPVPKETNSYSYQAAHNPTRQQQSMALFIHWASPSGAWLALDQPQNLCLSVFFTSKPRHWEPPQLLLFLLVWLFLGQAGFSSCTTHPKGNSFIRYAGGKLWPLQGTFWSQMNHDIEVSEFHLGAESPSAFHSL